jgi:type IV pilus assembly protein PilB
MATLNATIEEALQKLGLISAEQLKVAELEAVQTGKDVLTVIREKRFVGEEDLVKARAAASGVGYVYLVGQPVKPEIITRIDHEVARSYRAVVFGADESSIHVAMANPDNVQAIQFIERKTGLRVQPYLASDESIEYALHLYPADLSADVKAAISQVQQKTSKKPVDLADKEVIEGIIQDAPVTRAVNSILEYAVKARASDIHIEPREKNVMVRYRIDGVLRETMSLPKTIHSALISRVKILSNLKIDEHRVPQDGRFKLMMDGREVDLRVSISPVVFGEKVVLRILDKSEGIITVEQLGLRGYGLDLIRKGLEKPHGMTLVTGPTGSGKSTTLYAILSKLNTPGVNIITLEDPVEYHIDGINQIQVRPQVGLTFASGLRSILRQDPNIIMVGEIRDQETAQLAVQSALTGHVVLSTLHTNSAAGALPRLLDMNVEPFLIASTVSTIVAQRLVRRICPHCIEAYPASETQNELLHRVLGELLPQTTAEMAEVARDMGYQRLPLATQDGYTVFRGRGCKVCGGSGYLGREGVFEVFAVTDEMEHLLATHAPSSEVQRVAVEQGMLTMREDGLLKALNGETTLEEVARVAQE